MDDLAISSAHPTTSSPPRTSMNCAEHVLVTSSLFLSMLASAGYFCRSVSGFAISAIILVYYTAMIHLELLRKRRRGHVMWLVIFLMSWITIMSVSTAVLNFPPDPRDVDNIVVFLFLCAAVAIIIMFNHRYMVRREDVKSKDASDLV